MAKTDTGSSRCFLLEPVKQDIKDAEAFGAVAYLFAAGEQRPSIFSEGFQQEIQRRFEALHFNAEEDFFVLTGYQIALTVAVAVLVRAYGEVELLAYHAPSHSYTEIHVGGKLVPEST